MEMENDSDAHGHVENRTLPVVATVLWTQAGSAFGAGSETAGFGTSAPAAPGDVLARVDGIPITRAEVDHAIRLFLAQTRASHDLAPETRREAEDAALEQLITTRLLYRNGTKLEIRDLDKQVNDRIDQEKAKFPTPEAYEAALQANGFYRAGCTGPRANLHRGIQRGKQGNRQ